MQHDKINSSEHYGIQASGEITNLMPSNTILLSDGILISAAAATVAIAIVSAKFAAFPTIVVGI